jgi:hypothetical protein
MSLFSSLHFLRFSVHFLLNISQSFAGGDYMPFGGNGVASDRYYVEWREEAIHKPLLLSQFLQAIFTLQVLCCFLLL